MSEKLLWKPGTHGAKLTFAPVWFYVNECQVSTGMLPGSQRSQGRHDIFFHVFKREENAVSSWYEILI